MAACDFLPEGAYTTLRTYGGTGVLLLERHFSRLEESARLLGHPDRLQHSRLRDLLCDALKATPWHGSQESRVRLTLDYSSERGDIWISIEPLSVPTKRDYQEGVGTLTRPMHRENPHAKSNAFIMQSLETRKLIAGPINEVLMVGPDGTLLEGLSSNFFAVRNGGLYTATEGVLPGLTRSLVLAEVEEARIPLVMEGVRYDDLPELEEAFISSSGRGVLPIVAIDYQPIGTGNPGPITKNVMQRYNARVRAELEPVCSDSTSSVAKK